MSAISLYRIARWFYKHRVPLIPRLVSKIIFLLYNSDIPYSAHIGKGSSFGHGCIGVVIHPMARIGEYCIIAQNVTLAGKDGGAPSLGNFVYIGANSVVVGGVTLGDFSTVGSLTFVNSSVVEAGIVVGSPAKLLRVRSEEEISKWRDWVLGRRQHAPG